MTAQLSYWVLPVEDLDRAMTFFGTVLGWEFSEPGSAGGRHVLGSDPMGALGPAGGGNGRLRPSLAFQPDDLDAAVERVRELGGTAGEDPGNAGHGRWIECVDDQGTPFALYAPAEE